MEIIYRSKNYEYAINKKKTSLLREHNTKRGDTHPYSHFLKEKKKEHEQK